MVIERASATDRAFLAMDTGEVPEQFGVLLRLEPGAGPDLAEVRGLVARRVAAVPRLRQRLLEVPLGQGGPIWVDDAGFDITHHVVEAPCSTPGDEPALLETALAVALQPLSRNRPLWQVALVTGVSDGSPGLVVVMHHVLADGVGALAVLASLVDEGAREVDVRFPRPRPTRGSLVVDARRRRWSGLRRTAETVRLLRSSFSAAGGTLPPRAAPTSLIQQTGSRRAITVVRTDLTALRARAHAHGASANDAVLVAVAGALREVLASRRESIDQLVVTVPVSGRAAQDESGLGNMVSPMIVPVPTSGELGARLEEVAARVRVHKEAATGPPPIALLGGPFRLLARLGGYQWYMNHQHRMHTLVSHVRGPGEPLTFGGRRIVAAVPMGVAEGGNMTVYFEVLSYAGTLTIAAVVDPDHFPELDLLADALGRGIEQLLGLPADPSVLNAS